MDGQTNIGQANTKKPIKPSTVIPFFKSTACKQFYSICVQSVWFICVSTLISALIVGTTVFFNRFTQRRTNVERETVTTHPIIHKMWLCHGVCAFVFNAKLFVKHLLQFGKFYGDSLAYLPHTLSLWYMFAIQTPKSLIKIYRICSRENASTLNGKLVCI